MHSIRQHITLVEAASAQLRLADIAEIKVGREDADFFLVRRGTLETVGMPTREFNPEHIGITVTAPDLILPDYLFYAMMYLHQRGYWKPLAKGVLRLVHIRTDDVKSITLG